MNKIVILDGYTINPGDLSWSSLSDFGEVQIYDNTAPEQVDDRIRDAQYVLSSKVVFDEARFNRHPNLRYIGALATGYNVIDVKAAREHGVTVTNIPEYATNATAQMTIALLLELANHVGHHSRLVHEGKWSETEHFCFWDKPLTELSGKTIGLFGFGRIAGQTARVCMALGMRVIAHSRRPIQIPSDDLNGVESVSFENLLKQSDFLSFHCPLTEETRGIVNADTIATMKNGIYLINTARGPIFDEAAVYDALCSGKIAGVAVDVLSTEPPPENHILYNAPNCIITPHIAWAPLETRMRLIETAVSNLSAYLSGNPIHVVS